MTTMSMAAVAHSVGGVLRGADAAFAGVSTDTRESVAGRLFVALSGPNFDGHDFIGAAASGGAAGALVARTIDVDLPQVVVADPRAALGVYGRDWRLQFDCPVVAITGSSGKTTVKEMTAAILGTRGPVLATRGNLNNDIGLPLMLVELTDAHTAAVFEMGANHRGEIAGLAELARPDVGLVTNAGPAHLEGFGGIDGVAHGKGELYRSLSTGGCAVINANDRYAPMWREFSTHCRRIEFGIDVEAEWSARDVEIGPQADGGQRFMLHAPDGTHEVALAVPGRHNVANALAAAAAAGALGVPSARMVAALAGFAGVGRRMRMVAATGGARLIDDTYNANPASLDAALEVLATMPGRRWLVLGDMLELGDAAEAMHDRAGRHAREHGVERLFAYGPLAGGAARAFGAGAAAYDDVDELAARVADELAPDVTVLIKGSRGMRMERLVAALGGGG